MLEGLLVDLVPRGDTFEQMEHKWENSEAHFWASAGDRVFLSHATIERWHTEERERSAHRHPKGVRWGIQTKDGTPIGDIGIGWVLPHLRLAMLGAMIGEPDYWGGGYGTDALLLIVDYAFDWLDMRRLWLGTMSINTRVVRQMEKVGFKPEVRSRDAWLVSGHGFADEIVYGLLREEWPGRDAVIARLGLVARSE
ncbi:MAG: GNAT family N-acetyltransferase [Anaerolineae bacterium]|nr:GNAT family N-acetyltransferase [Anaerolineae bacterium]